jgi:peptidylprolyl isomerase
MSVKVHYTGKLKDSSTLDSSADREPLEFTLGHGEIITGFEEAVVGMEPGESKSFDIPADKTYGPHRKELFTEIGRSQVPPKVEIHVGQQLKLQSPDGRKKVVTITEITESSVTLDANHPLAGQDLQFEIELLGVA